MAEMLGRPLTKDESVHHKDGNRLNNDASNLELWSRWQPAGQRVSDKLISRWVCWRGTRQRLWQDKFLSSWKLILVVAPKGFEPSLPP